MEIQFQLDTTTFAPSYTPRHAPPPPSTSQEVAVQNPPSGWHTVNIPSHPWQQPAHPPQWSILPVPGLPHTYQCRPVHNPTGYGEPYPPPPPGGEFPVFSFGDFPGSEPVVPPRQEFPSGRAGLTLQFPTANQYPELPAYMSGIQAHQPPPAPELGPPPAPPATVKQDTYIWCGRIDDKTSFDESSGLWFHKRCRHLILRSQDAIQHHYREVHRMEWFTSDQKCNWGSSCKVRKMGKNLAKHIYEVHVKGKERLCEGKGCKLEQKQGSRWCGSSQCEHIEPLPKNVSV
ncbi:hypothetical protein NMY22_g741 [Coprinellus aureogranulatus]|nr:hypothetical protein NMY22_g741 [Coprinellus aureogranulatus]